MANLLLAADHLLRIYLRGKWMNLREIEDVWKHVAETKESYTGVKEQSNWPVQHTVVEYCR